MAPACLCARARCGSAPVSGRSTQNSAKVLTQGELFKLKLAGKLLIAGEERSVPQTSPKSSGWGSELLANCNGGLDPDGKGCRLSGEESAGTADPAPAAPLPEPRSLRSQALTASSLPGARRGAGSCMCVLIREVRCSGVSTPSPFPKFQDCRISTARTDFFKKIFPWLFRKARGI